jgi:hypothetical protein
LKEFSRFNPFVEEGWLRVLAVGRNEGVFLGLDLSYRFSKRGGGLVVVQADESGALFQEEKDIHFGGVERLKLAASTTDHRRSSSPSSGTS